VRGANASHVILRTAWVFSPFGRNFVKTMLRAAAHSQELRVVDDQRGTPTTASDLARAIALIGRRLVETPADSDLYGTFHYAGGEATTWFRFANAIFAESKSRGGPWARLAPIGTADYPTPARRPADSRLDCRKIEHAYGIGPAVWCAGLCDTLDRLLADTRKDAVA
jgi:dTDP-4-dehydrorhamnose reductase